MIPDMDGDLGVELAVAGMGAATATVNDGAAWLFVGSLSGALTVDDAQANWVGDQASDVLGASLAGGDWNMDGIGDLLIGAPGQGLAGYGPGALLLYYGG